MQQICQLFSTYESASPEQSIELHSARTVVRAEGEGRRGCYVYWFRFTFPVSISEMLLESPEQTQLHLLSSRVCLNLIDVQVSLR